MIQVNILKSIKNENIFTLETLLMSVFLLVEAKMST